MRPCVSGDARLDPVPEGRRAAAAEGQHQDAFRIDAGGDPRRDRLDQHRRLAGAGTADDQQRAVGVRGDVVVQRVGAQAGHGRWATANQTVRRAAHRR